jgi:hypothetical protein
VRRATVLALILFAVCSGAVDSPAAETPASNNNSREFHLFSHSFGLELGFVSIPFGFDDPYSAPIGAGLFYEMRPLAKSLPFFFGAVVSYYDFNPLRKHFGDSSMIQLGLYAGYDFVFPFTDQTALTLSPYAGYKHYFRKHMFRDEEVSTNRPILLAGSKLNLYVSRRFSFGVGFEYNLIMEQSPIHTAAQTDRITVGF